jgi:glyceraldehyde-3-phosphate dehydrogenase/erythrose-4-phosphate dehydrogenase
MPIRVAINGFGRIGRLVFRVLSGREGCEVVAINDLADSSALAHLLTYDTVHGRYAEQVRATEGGLTVGSRQIRALAEREPGNLPWRELNVDFVVESTGIFRSLKACMQHVEAGAKKVLLTVPPKGDVDAMIVMGVNEEMPELDGKLDGFAMRVPVPDGSVVDLTANLGKAVSKDDVNSALKAAAEGPLKGILAYTEDPIVSSDVIGDSHSSVVDGSCTMVADGGSIVKIVSWYDNEWGYSNRVADLIIKAHQLAR